MEIKRKRHSGIDKLSLFGVWALVSLFSLIVVNSAMADIDPSLVGWWKFDEGRGAVVKDSSRKHNNGKIIGASWVEGVSNKALYFDGKDDYVEIPDSRSLNPAKAITIECWINIKSETSGSERIIEKSYNQAYCITHYGGNKICFEGKIGDRAQRFIWPGQVPFGKWAHIAMTYDGAILRFYVDGLDAGKASGSPAGALGKTSRVLRIGGYDPGTAAYWFNGCIDEVKIYNRALSEKEIKKEIEEIKKGFAAAEYKRLQESFRRRKMKTREKADRFFDLAVMDSDFRDNLYIYLKNPNEKPLDIKQIYINGDDLRKLAEKGQEVPLRKPTEGVVRWYDIVPNPIPPAGWGTVKIRFGSKGEIGESVKVKVITKSGLSFSKDIEPMSEFPVQFTSYGFDEQLDKLYLYLEKNRLAKITGVLINGKKVDAKIKEVEIEDKVFVSLSVSPANPFRRGEYKVVKVSTDVGASNCIIKVMEPFFPVGIWSVTGGYEGEHFKDCLRHFINFADIGCETRPVKEEYQLKRFIHPLNAMNAYPSKPQAHWAKELAPWSVGAWLLWDEPGGEEQSRRMMELVGWMENFRKYGGIPVFVNHSAVDHLLEYEYDFTDIMSIDCYPVPGETRGPKPGSARYREDRGSLYQVSEAMDKARERVKPKPVWFVPQAYYSQREESYEKEEDILRLPTADEERLMVYEAVSHGAKGIIYFSSIGNVLQGSAKFIDEEVLEVTRLLWQEMGKINSELQLLGPLLWRGEVLPLAESNQAKVEACSILSGQDVIILFVLNHDYDSPARGRSTFRSAENVKVKLNLPEWFVPQQVFKLSSDGLSALEYRPGKGGIILSVGEVRVSETVVVSADKELFSRLERKRKALHSRFR